MLRGAKMPHTFANTMFSDAAKKLQNRFGSRAAYERMSRFGDGEQSLGPDEAEFIAARNSFYMSTVTSDGWPYIQHRGGPAGFLRVIDERTIAFADYSGNKQYISAGNLSVNDRVALFLMDYPNRTRLKIIGHAQILEPGENPALEAQLRPLVPGGKAGPKVERIIPVEVVGFDWNCNQHITPRYSLEELAMLEPIQTPMQKRPR
jgi:predicted pyridoxine 5'-phosphate oxidase superfamily flavin-nucleotide-binding protein